MTSISEQVQAILSTVTYSELFRLYNMDAYFFSGTIFYQGVTMQEKLLCLSVHASHTVSCRDLEKNKTSQDQLLLLCKETIKATFRELLTTQLTRRIGIKNYRGYFKLLQLKPILPETLSLVFRT